MLLKRRMDSETQKPITLKGSVSIVKEFFGFFFLDFIFPRFPLTLFPFPSLCGLQHPFSKGHLPK